MQLNGEILKEIDRNGERQKEIKSDGKLERDGE